MIYPHSFEEKIGFDIVKKLIIAECVSPMGQKRIDGMSCLTDFATLMPILEATEEFHSLLLFGDAFTADNYYDLTETFSKIRLDGTFVEVEELSQIRGFLTAVIDAVVYFKVAHEKGRYPRLWALCEPIAIDRQLLDSIDRLLDSKGNLRDNASEKLRQIKSDIIRISREADNKIRKLLNAAKEEDVVKEDAEMTIRNGRLCIPVPAPFKRRLKGFIHDESATGQTVFIEPTEVFDSNNELKDLLNAERREVIRILTDITNEIRPHLKELSVYQDFLGDIDAIRAKAKFAIEIGGVLPHVADKPCLNWQHAVHPLLFINFKEQKKKVEPLDIQLHENQRILIISGPNAGGKSVCLKTVGLLQYMLQCGLLIPVKETSDAGVFTDFFIDMGDEQSIDNDLSTYSSHLQNLKMMVENLRERSLFLIDEFGSGTEPTLGGAMAEAVLEHIYQTGATGIITTHYGNLKMFPDRYPQAVNGAMLFDVQAMRPLFSLSIGKPGSSFTYEIARKIGLPSAIIDAAIGKSGTAQIDYEAKLEEIEVEKIALDNELKRMQQADEKLAELISLYDDKFRNFDKVRKEILQKAKNQANAIIENANKVIENTIREIKENKADKEKTKQARTEIHKVKQELAKEVESVEQEEIVRPILPKKKPEKKVQPAIPDTTPLKAGDSVFIDSIQTVGEVVSIKGEDVTVSFNSVSFKTTIDKVEKISKREGRTIQRAVKFDGGSMSEMMNRKVAMFQTTLDLRGERAEDALALLENYIDEAVLLSIHQVKILHGKGNGILRARVREFLAKRKEVESFRDEVLEAGGSGITIVEL